MRVMKGSLRLWVAAEAERIRGVLESWGFYLAATGQLLDKMDTREGAA